MMEAPVLLRAPTDDELPNSSCRTVYRPRSRRGGSRFWWRRIGRPLLVTARS